MTQAQVKAKLRAIDRLDDDAEVECAKKKALNEKAREELRQYCKHDLRERIDPEFARNARERCVYCGRVSR